MDRSSNSQQTMKDDGGKRVNILLLLTDRIRPDSILPCLEPRAELNIRVIRKQKRPDAPDVDYGLFPRVEFYPHTPSASVSEEGYSRLAQQSHQHARWADVLFVEMDANTVSAMLAGLAYDTTLSVLRCWNISKKVIILPQLSIDQWRSPIWKGQVMEIQNKWGWLHLLRPALWDIAGDSRGGPDYTIDLIWDWEGPGVIVEAIEAEAKRIIHNHRKDSSPTSEGSIQPYHKSSSTINHHHHNNCLTRPNSKLPPEIWTLIFEYVGDWEYSTALGIHTTIPIPKEWLPHIPCSPSRPKSLEYILLTAPYSTIRSALDNNSSGPSTLSHQAVELIFKFSLTPVLSHLATHHKDIFWTSFGLALIPHKASVIYNNPTILEWWRTEPAILKKDYGPEAVDGASRAGFVDVLDWWASSGLKMRYTGKALESASAKGHVDVLDWWKETSRSRAGSRSPLPLKVGKSILAAAQSGRAATIAWWDQSGIPYSHEDGVARLASTHGHVNVLELWRDLKGTKMIFDNQVLVGATKNGHADVLEWWKTRSGVRVEYKTCDIEEAMEDSLGGSGEGEVRKWWERNGLNLGVGTSEWMKVKTLGD